MKQPKLAILLPDLRGGGVERIRLVLAAQFLSRGYDVDIVLLQAKGELLDQVPEGANVVALGASRFRAALPSLVGYLRRARPDGMLAAMWPLTALAPVSCKIAGVATRVLVSEHGMLSAQYRRGLDRFLLRATTAFAYRMADASVAVSQGLADDLSNLSRVPRERFRVIPNPVRECASPSAESIREIDRLWGCPRGRRVLTVGTLKPVKNQALLCRAFSRVVGQGARLMLLGQGQQEAQLRAMVTELGIAENVIFAGFHPDPSPFYATADLFTLSSDFEGFGNVIVEALSCGLPVVSTDCPSGPAEILENGRYGRLVPVGNADALAAAITTALDSQHDRASLKRRAADYTPEGAAGKYLDVLFPG